MAAIAKLEVTQILANVCQQQELKVDEVRWNEAENTLERLLLEERLELRLATPLFGIRIEEPLELGPLTIRKRDLAERSKFLEADTGFTGSHRCETVVELRAVLQFDEPDGRHREVLALCVRALRVWCPFPIVSAHVERNFVFGGSFAGRSGPPLHPPMMSEDLPAPDEFKKFWNRAQPALEQGSPELQLALERFDLMHDRPRHTDRVLDAMIVLEALLLGKNRQELSFRLQLYTAHFLGETHAERTKIADLIRRAYKLRSGIAHGSATSGKAREVVSELEALARRALLRYCKEAGAQGPVGYQEKLIARLEANILERRQP